jgi:hypothetical protein
LRKDPFDNILKTLASIRTNNTWFMNQTQLSRHTPNETSNNGHPKQWLLTDHSTYHSTELNLC